MCPSIPERRWETVCGPLESIQDALDWLNWMAMSTFLWPKGRMKKTLLWSTASQFMGVTISTFRAMLSPTTLRLLVPVTLQNGHGIDITSPTVFDGFTVQGNANTRDGSSAIGVWIETAIPICN